MDVQLLHYIREFFKLVNKHLVWVVLAASVISFAILGAGVLYHPKYQTSITIYADHKNIIEPLLKGQAPVTAPPNDQVHIVKQVMFSQRILQKVVHCCIDKTAGPNSDAMQRAMRDLRNNVSVSSPQRDYIQVTYDNPDPHVSYAVVNKITNLFIEQSAQNARRESKNAYDFISQQVEAYKKKLLAAETKLKNFNAANTDGVESQVTSAISRLQSNIEGEVVDIEAQQVKIAALQDQLVKQNRYAATDYTAQVYRNQLAKLQAQLQTLRLNYKDDYPDIVTLKLQIQDLKKTIINVEDSSQTDQSGNLNDQQQLNPIYQQLSNQLSDAQVNLETKKERLAADKKRLKDQYARSKRVAANQATLSQLTRGYTVNKDMYNNLLQRKEQARISMTLNLAGDGLSYKVLEPAAFPVDPTGLRFLHFVVAGPIIGLILPLSFIVIMILLDPRIRFANQINRLFPGIVIAILPERQKVNWAPAAVSFAVLGSLYIGSALAYHFI